MSRCLTDSRVKPWHLVQGFQGFSPKKQKTRGFGLRMTGKNIAQGILRQLPPGGAVGQECRYELKTNQEVVIGRALDCQIVIDSEPYGMVSRYHAALRSQVQGKQAKFSPQPDWEVCDLQSANGTYVNGQRLQGCHLLQVGDRIQLGKNGPDFIFEYQCFLPETQAENHLSTISHQPDSISLSQLFPIVSTGRDLIHKAYLIPGIITVGFVVWLFAAVGEPILFNVLLAAYISGSAYYFVYQLCGKHKPWWVLLGSAFATILILRSPVLPIFTYIFRQLLPGNLPNPDASISFPVLLMKMFFGAGLMEELIKALPVLGAYFLGRQLPSPWRGRIGVWEPLDGILLGAASAVGFTLLETLGQYVPEVIQNTTFQVGEGAGQLVGLQLLIPRILGSVAGHMAYSGYFGYFMGLSVLKPSKRYAIFGVGYLSAAGLHALWNTTGFFSGLGLAVVGVLSYAFLAAAILKARALSPTRSQNFATRFISRP